MPDLVDLQCRNAALEVELRLTKEQLTKAQEATVHLVNALTTQTQSLSHGRGNPLKSQLEAVLAENAQLRRCLHNFNPQQTDNNLSRPTIESGLKHTRSLAQDDPFVDVPTASFASSVPKSCCTNLPRSNAGRNDAAVTTCSGQPVSKRSDLHTDSVIQAQALPHKAIGLDITGHPPHCRTSVVVTPISSPILQPIKANYHYGNIARSRQLCGLSNVSNSLTTPKSPCPGRSRHFTQRDRAYLLGIACFIEDLDDEDYVAKWDSIAKRRGLASAEAWQTFYEGTIRPIHYEQQASKQAATNEANDEGIEDVGDSVADPRDNRDCEPGGIKVQRADSSKLMGCWGGRRVVHNDAGLIDFEDTIEGDQKLCLSSLVSQGLAPLCWAPKYVAELPKCVMEQVDTNGLPETLVDRPLAKSLCIENDGQHSVFQGKGLHTTISETAVHYAVATVSDPSDSQSPVKEAPLPTGQDRMSLTTYGGTRKPRCCHGPRNEIHLHHPTFAAQHDFRLLRFVMIENVPPSVSLAQVLDKVRGGKVVSATYLALSEMHLNPAIETNAVLVTFMDAHHADAYAKFSRVHAICFQSKTGTSPLRAKVTLLPYPIRSPPVHVIGKMHRDELSRVLYIKGDSTLDADHIISQAIHAAHRPQGAICRYPIRTGRNKHGILFFEFPGVEDAILAHAGLEKLTDLSWCQKGFLSDPSAGPLGLLLANGNGYEARNFFQPGVNKVDEQAISPLIDIGLAAESMAAAAKEAEAVADRAISPFDLGRPVVDGYATENAADKMLSRDSLV